jgi:hypothetical protein
MKIPKTLRSAPAKPGMGLNVTRNLRRRNEQTFGRRSRGLLFHRWSSPANSTDSISSPTGVCTRHYVPAGVAGFTRTDDQTDLD